MRKWIILIVVIILAIVGYNYIYQDHRDIETEVSEFTVTSSEIHNAYKENQAESEQKYINKTIEITGYITELNANDITLDEKIFCQFSTAISQEMSTDKIKIKGRVIGYDDLLELVKLDQCHIIN